MAWGTWLSRVLRDDAEAGGLQVAIIQLAITVDARAAGSLFDWAGWKSTFGFAALLLLGSSLTTLAPWLHWEREK